MANKKFSDLTATTTLATGDLFAVETAVGNSRKITVDNLKVALFSGALVHKAADETTANYSATPAVPWDSETSGYDTDAYHNNSTNNTRLTIPANGKYQLSGHIEITGGTLTSSDYARIFITKNGSFAWIGRGASISEISAGPGMTLTTNSAVVDCVAGDYFELVLDTESDTSITVKADVSWFAIERIA